MNTDPVNVEQNVFKPLHLRPKKTIALAEFLELSAKFYGFDSQAVRKFDSLYCNGKRLRFQNLTDDFLLSTEDLIKVFPRPKRFSLEVLSLESILYEDQNLLAIDKPKGLPSIPVASNATENCKAFFEAKLQQPLLPLHRLDELTCGVLLFAKNTQTVRQFQKDHLIGRIQKIYRTLVSKPLSLGRYEHYLLKGRGRMLVFDGPVSGGKLCRLEINKRRGLEDRTRLDIKLITGRTHQIRAQLSHLGSPILGDPIYSSSSDIQDFYLCARQVTWNGLKIQSQMSGYTQKPKPTCIS
ncbi:MAG: RluA family pseudouridine synthase [Pseudomonadota bacterium]